MDNGRTGNGLTRRRVLAGGAALASLAIAGDRMSMTDAEVAAQDSTSAPASGPLEGEVALVTGAARGIGRAIAVTLAQNGADVAALDIAAPIATVTQYQLATPADLAETGRLIEAEGRRALTIRVDVRDAEGMRRAADRVAAELGRFDMAIANAGICVYGPLGDVSPQAFQDVVDVNLIGVANTMRAALPHLGNGGRIVATASTEGRHGAPAVASYAAAKWGVIGLVKAIATEVGQQNIRVNAVTPTGVVTAMTENEATYAWANPADPTRENLEAALRAYNVLPVGRLQPQDVADGVLFLVAPDSRYVSGAALDLAAGANARYTA